MRPIDQNRRRRPIPPIQRLHRPRRILILIDVDVPIRNPVLIEKAHRPPAVAAPLSGVNEHIAPPPIASIVHPASLPRIRSRVASLCAGGKPAPLKTALLRRGLSAPADWGVGAESRARGRVRTDPPPLEAAAPCIGGSPERSLMRRGAFRKGGFCAGGRIQMRNHPASRAGVKCEPCDATPTP